MNLTEDMVVWVGAAMKEKDKERDRNHLTQGNRFADGRQIDLELIRDHE